MASMDEQILRATKEIVVKFIETGRVSPSGVHDLFRDVYRTVQSAAKGWNLPAQPSEDQQD
jgi:hypothetical protein